MNLKREAIPVLLLRAFRMIAYLKSGRRSLGDIAREFDMHERSVRRYLALFAEVDLNVEKDFENRYFIAVYD